MGGAIELLNTQTSGGPGDSFDQPEVNVFLGRVVREFPFPLTAIQSDGGGELLGAFGPAANELKLLHYSNRPTIRRAMGR
jgi:hypothetical protein